MGPQDHSGANVEAFMAVIRAGESGDVYNRLLGGGMFFSYTDHPAVNQGFAGVGNSHAAGAYQFQPGTWKEAQSALGLADFSPENQDAAAVYLVQRRGAYDDVRAGRIAAAVERLKPEWQFFQNWSLAKVVNEYETYGGTLA